MTRTTVSCQVLRMDLLFTSVYMQEYTPSCMERFCSRMSSAGWRWAR